MSSSYVGIDLGTTYCSAAVFSNDKAKVFEFDGENSIPSMVYYGTPNQYGYKAQKLLNNNEYTKNVIYDSKRMLGKTYKDLSNEIPKWTFGVKPDSNGNPLILIDNGKCQTKIKPYEVSASILNYIRKNLEKKGIPLDHVVVTVPAHFDQKQLDEVRNAVKIAEFPNPEKVFLFKEPSSAALCYRNTISLDKERTVLVYDFGGGTFDLSLVKISKDQIEVIAQDGDNHLGGRDIDNGIVEDAIKSLSMKYPKIDIEACKSILVLDAEKAKKSISNGHKSSTISLRIENEIIEYTFMKNKLEKILDPLIQRTITIIRRLLNSHKDAKVESILLVGGTSMIYYVKESLELEFEDDNIRVINSVDPLTAVAIGAAQKAFFEFYKKQEEMNGNQIVLPKNFPKKMIEAVSITYGFECYIHGTYEKTMEKMIMKDTKLPSEPITTITS